MLNTELFVNFSQKLIKSKESKKAYYLINFILLTALFLGIYFENSSLILFVTILSSLLILIKPSLGLPLYLVLCFSGNYFTLMEGMSISRIIGLAFVISSLVLFIAGKTRINFFALMTIILLFTISFFSLTYSLSFTGSVDSMMTLSLNFAIFIAIIAAKYKDEEIIMDGMAFDIIYTTIFIVLYMLTKTEPLAPLKGLGYWYGRFTIARNVNPGDVGRSFAQLSTIIFYYLNVRKLKALPKLIYYFVFGIMIILLIGSGSRTSQMGFVIGMGIISFWLVRVKKIKVSKVVYPFVLFFLGIIVYSIVDPELISRFTLSSVVESHGTRRFIIWSYYVKNVLLNPKYLLLGVGIGGKSEIKALGNVPFIFQKPAHNLFLSLLVELGLVGLMAYTMFFITTLLKGLRSFKKNSLIIPFLAMFVLSIFMGIGEPMFTRKIFWVSMGMIWRYSKN